MRINRRKTSFVKEIAIKGTVQVILIIALCEVVLRLCNYWPWSYEGDAFDAPILEDRSLGWRSRFGTHVIHGVNGEKDHPIEQTVWQSGARATQQAPFPLGEGDVVLVGDSYLYGFKLTDRDTFGWQLHARFPSLKVENQAVAGYGTVQSLLQIEEILQQSPSKERVFIYGFNSFHEYRNVGSWGWQRPMAMASTLKNFFLPIARFVNGELRILPPTRLYPNFPLRTTSSLVRLVEEVIGRVRTIGNDGEEQMVTEMLIDLMNERITQAGSKFLVMFLDDSNEALKAYIDFFNKKKIIYVNCSASFRNDEGERLDDGWHPTKHQNEYWVECVAPVIKEYKDF